MSTTRLVIASSNTGKLAELRACLAGLPLQLVDQGSLGVGDADESALTFIENALIKARHASASTGSPALGDDSGLLVEALGGAPGLRSARYAGEHGNAAANNALLLQRLNGVPAAQRRAHFYCVLVIVRRADDPQPLIAEGVWPGYVLEAARGNGGFGYDPLFFDPLQGLSAAEMDTELKNRISHRGQALSTLRERLQSSPL